MATPAAPSRGAPDEVVLLSPPTGAKRPPWRGWPIALLLAVELALSVEQLGAMVDPWPAAARAATVALVAAALLRWPRLPAWLRASVSIVAGVRLLLVCVAAPQAWNLQETITSNGQSVASDAQTGSIDFTAGQVPAHLINDVRLNFFGSNGPARETLPVVLTVSAFVQGDGDLQVASTAPAKVTLGTATLFDSTAVNARADGTVLTPKGPRTYEQMRSELKAAGYNGAEDDATVVFVYQRTVQAGGWDLNVHAPRQQLLTVAVAPQDVSTAALSLHVDGLEWSAAPSAAWQRALSRLLTLFDWLAIGLATVALVAALRTRWRLAAANGRWSYAVASALAVVVTLPHVVDWYAQHGNLLVMSGGNDWLTYEGFARDIRGGSPLMLLGAPVGQAAPFGPQVLYPFLLAIEHLALGEPLQGIVLLQLLSMGLVVAVIAMAVLPRAAGIAGLLVLLATGVVGAWFDLAGYVLSENLLVPVFAVLLLVVSRHERSSRRQLVLVGVLMGLAVLARTTPWLAVPFVIAILCRTQDRREWLANAAAMLLPIVLLAGLIPVRNLIASGAPTPLPKSV
ncbi:MAG: hypothetical protein JO247_21375, partial [Chloroflexi bacterium]|nr:hypothetical protein [Chloroflexota bacterium]